MSHDVAVVGSLSVDFVMQVPRRPGKGETIAGFDFSTFVGGKGNNQALAAARAGSQVAMIGRVGTDSFADEIAGKLEADSIDTSYLFRDARTGTGIANIYVDEDGDNSIVIVPRANGCLSKEDIQAASAAIASAAIMLMQMEIPQPTIAAAAAIAHDAGVLVALNPAPAPPDGALAPELLCLIDILIPNQSEAELLTGIKIHDQITAAASAAALQGRGAKQVIITLGEQGALVLSGEAPVFVPSFAVTAVDTTAAGDAFCGALATTRRGAEPSLPMKESIEKLAGYR